MMHKLFANAIPDLKRTKKSLKVGIFSIARNTTNPPIIKKLNARGAKFSKIR